MKRLLPLILLIPCFTVRANTRRKEDRINNTEGVSINWDSRSNLNFATIKGFVKDDTGQGLVGVTVSVKGTSTRTQTDAGGHFTIAANQRDVLVFSYIGFVQKEVTVTNSTDVTVQLAADSKGLDEVVVTALGIKRSEKSLTYATQQVSGKALTDVKTDNLVNALNGKVAGLTITPSASGVGGSSKVILRGNRSLDGNNQPLYVIDGIPISNSGSPHGQPADSYGGNPEGGDGISNLNPDDIE
ncbi:MAG TPA: carboxypeptidase-like regulatory domain-containing protein, partial [Pedobacter sp.]